MICIDEAFHGVSHGLGLSESWCCRIAYDQLIVNLEALYQIIIDLISICTFHSSPSCPSSNKGERGVTYPIQVAHPLVQTWCKYAVHITEQPIAFFNADLFAQEIQHDAESRRSTDLEHPLFQDWSTANGLKADGDCSHIVRKRKLASR